MDATQLAKRDDSAVATTIPVHCQTKTDTFHFSKQNFHDAKINIYTVAILRFSSINKHYTEHATRVRQQKVAAMWRSTDDC